MHAGGGSGCTGDRISILGSSELLLLERAPGHPAAQELQSAFFQHVRVPGATGARWMWLTGCLAFVVGFSRAAGVCTCVELAAWRARTGCG